jgi:hypothetical protein
MLHKCANPACKVPFRSLREGKLFLAETCPSNIEEGEIFQGNRRKVRRREHFWLCDTCYTLRFDATLGMLTVPFTAGANQRFLTRASVNA